MAVIDVDVHGHVGVRQMRCERVQRLPGTVDQPGMQILKDDLFDIVPRGHSLVLPLAEHEDLGLIFLYVFLPQQVWELGTKGMKCSKKSVPLKLFGVGEL